MRRHVLPMLVVLNLALAGVLAWLWFTPAGALRDVRWQPPQPVPPALADAKALPEFDIDVARYVATLERPLFVPTRRPPPPPQDVASAPAADPLPQIRLLGLYGNEQVGGVIASIDGQVRRLKVGEAIGSWSVREVRRNEVVIARADDVRTIALVRSPSDAAAAESVAASGSSRAAAATPPTAQAQRQRDLELTRERVRRMNVVRARTGLPPLPEP